MLGNGFGAKGSMVGSSVARPIMRLSNTGNLYVPGVAGGRGDNGYGSGNRRIVEQNYC